MLCIGSSLEVYPVAQLPETTLADGGQIAIVTQGRTPFDRHAAVRMDGDVVDELEAVLAALELGYPGMRHRPRPERGLDPSERERDRLALGGRRAGRERRLRRRARRLALAAQLRRARSASAGAAGSAGELGERGVERDQHLQRGLARRGPGRGRAGPAAPAPRRRARRWRPLSSAASRAWAAGIRARGAGAGGIDQLARVGPQTVGDLLAGAVAERGRRARRGGRRRARAGRR